MKFEIEIPDKCLVGEMFIKSLLQKELKLDWDEIKVKPLGLVIEKCLKNMMD